MSTEYKVKEFGRLLYDTRTFYEHSLDYVANLTGVDRQFITRVERGQVQKPSYPDVTIFTTQAYPYTPNDVAALAGLWVPEEEEPETVRPQIILETENYLRGLNPEHAQTFTMLLRLLIQQHQALQVEAAQPTESEHQPPASLPEWARKKLLSSNSTKSNQ